MTAEQQPEPESSAAHRGVRTQCGDCFGEGARAQPRMWSGQLSTNGPRWNGTLVVPMRCKTCKGTGWINGF